MSRKPNPVPYPDHADPEKIKGRTDLATFRQADEQQEATYAKGSDIIHDPYCKCGACESYRELLANEH